MNHLIKTEADHETAIERLSALMDADPPAGSDEAGELDLLAHLIELYESENHPVPPPDPIDAIRFRMEQQGLRNKDLIPYLGSASRVSEVLSGKRELSLSMIRKLHSDLGIPADVLLAGRSKDEAAAADAEDELLSGFSRDALNDMLRRGWLGDIGTTLKEARGRIGDALNEFLGGDIDPALVPAMLRQSRAKRQPGHLESLLAWKLRVLSEAGKGPRLGSWRPERIDDHFVRHLAGLSFHDQGPVLATELLRRLGIAVVIEPHLPGTRLDGAALAHPEGFPVIGLTLRFDRIDHFWFCLMHELAHVKLHLEQGEVLDEDLGKRTTTKREREADRFANAAFVPAREWKAVIGRCATDAAAVRAEAKRRLIHAALIAGRIRAETGDFRRFSQLVGQGRVRRLFADACES